MPDRLPTPGGRDRKGSAAGKKKRATGRSWSRAESDLVKRLAEAGATNASIAAAVQCSPTTLKRRFGRILVAAARGSGAAPLDVSDAQREVVKAMAGFGFPQDQIATALGISDKSLRAHCSVELAAGEVTANYNVAKTLYEMATTARIPAAAIFWMKARMGWSDRVVVSHSGGVAVSGVVQHDVSVRDAVARLDADGRAALRVVLSGLGAESRLH